MSYSINFPNLNIYLDHVGKNITVFGFTIHYYGIVLAIAMLAGTALACYWAKRTGQDPDQYVDLAIIGIITSVIGARIYYVVFQWDLYKDDLLSIFNIRQGGLAIYGGVIAAVITAWLFAKKRKLSFGEIADTASMGLVLGQAIGRWGNFFNREAFGDYTDNLLAMQLPYSAVRSAEVTQTQLDNLVVVDGVTYIQAHPTFLYESLWNLALLVILMLFYKHRRFQGQGFLMYMFGYGVGRFWIESLRTDQLLFPVLGFPVSMALGGIIAVVSVILMIVGCRRARTIQASEKAAADLALRKRRARRRRMRKEHEKRSISGRVRSKHSRSIRRSCR